MPVTFILKEEDNLLMTTASGILNLEAILEHIREKAAQQVFEKNELFDARDVLLDLSVSDLQTIANHARMAMEGIQAGRTALVTNNNFLAGIAGTYKTLVGEAHPHIEVFQHVDDARVWLTAD